MTQRQNLWLCFLFSYSTNKFWQHNYHLTYPRVLYFGERRKVWFHLLDIKQILQARGNNIIIPNRSQSNVRSYIIIYNYSLLEIFVI